MDTTSPAKAFVQAFLFGDEEEGEKQYKRLSDSDPHYRHCRLIQAIWKSDRGEPSPLSVPEVMEAITHAQKFPSDDHEIMGVVLIVSVIAYTYVKRTADAARALRLLKQMELSSPLLQAWSLYAEAHVMDRRGDVRKKIELFQRACRLPVPAGARIWFLVRLYLAQAAMGDMDTTLAERVLAEVEAHPTEDPEVRRLLSLRRLRLTVIRGQTRKGLALLDAVPPPSSPRDRELLLSYRVRLLLAAGRFTEAGTVIEAATGREDYAFLEFHRGKVCLHRGDVPGAREHTRRALSAAGGHPVAFLTSCSGQLASAELAAGCVQTARILLEMDEALGSVDMDFAHLYLLEGDVTRAARHFRNILDRNDPLLLRGSLRNQPGLTGPQIAMLWTLADELEPGETPSAAPDASVTEEGALVGETPGMRDVRDRIARFAPLGETVLVTGETGTGKDLVARILHRKSPRAGAPFLAVNCGAISDTLIESELFGHVKGAFTGADHDTEGLFTAAGEGIIFLDEISSMSPRLQGALLRVLENGEILPVGAVRSRRVKARVIAASNRSLEEMIARGEFRADLYYRLARLHVEIPPLRERLADIPLLARHFLKKSFAYGEVAVGEDLLRALAGHSWPGNVRELQNEIERIVILSGGQALLHAGLFSRPRPSETEDAAPPAAAPSVPAGKPGRTRDRLTRLRELFQGHSRLTRAEVVDLLDCSPNTATSYLKTLEAEGVIRRVCTSASLRTSYFVPSAP
ncbi:MAG: sigma 54-interacting transcriptional regulator [Planctomycetota bacterium]